MANVKLIFQDCFNDNNYRPVLTCDLRGNFLVIQIEDSLNTDDFQIIGFDKSTAIKFAKTLRTEINKMQEEGQNG